MPARVNTSVPADSLRDLAVLLEDLDQVDHPARLAVTAILNLARYAPAGRRVDLTMSWESEADRLIRGE